METYKNKKDEKIDPFFTAHVLRMLLSNWISIHLPNRKDQLTLLVEDRDILLDWDKAECFSGPQPK